MSSLLAYDKGVYEKIKALYPEVFFAAPEEHFAINARYHNGKVLMPFIGLWRMPDFNVNRELYNDSYVRRGPIRPTVGTSKNLEYPNQRVNMQGIPVSLQYQLDIYAVKRDHCDGLAAELTLEFFQNPWVNVIQKDMGDEFVQQFNLDMEDSIVDNTSISEFDETNRFYRLTITLNMPSAVIYKISDMTSIEKVEISYGLLDTDLADDSKDFDGTQAIKSDKEE
jgi:hypothetical protein